MSRYLKLLFLIALAALTGACGKSIHTESIKPQVLFEPVHCVAVMPFENLTPYPRAGDIVADFFAGELYARRQFRVIDRMEVQQAARRVNLRIPNRVSSDFARKLGEQLNVDGVFYGSVSEYWYPNTAGTDQTDQLLKGDEPAVGINARMIAVETGEMLWSSSASRSSYSVVADRRDPLSRIAQVLITKMMEQLSRSLQGRQINVAEPCGGKLAPMEGRFHGLVIDAVSREPVQQAAMLIKAPEEVRVDVDPETGAYLTPPLPAGMVEYTVLANGYETTKDSIEVVSNRNIEQTIALSPRERAQKKEVVRPAIIGGRVLDAGGLPIAARVRFDPDPGFGTLKTNPDTGRFRKEIKPGRFTTTFSAEGFKSKEKAVRLEQGQNFFVEVTLDPIQPERPKGAALQDDRIVLQDQVNFVTGSDRLAESSYPVLLQVADVLKENPNVALVQVEGHTDDRGGAQTNQRLSQKRAETVVQFLIESGVEPSRLTPIGFGEAVPIADNDTAEGRARNRRVEFTVLEQK